MHKIFAVFAALALAVGINLATAPTQAQASPRCQYGWVCTWEGLSGSGRSHVYSHSANHNHEIASVYFNYARVGTRFWTGYNGTGTVIVYYHRHRQGFHNWSHNNWWRSHSHVDING